MSNDFICPDCDIHFNFQEADIVASYCPQCGKENVYVDGGDSIIRELVASGQLSKRYLQGVELRS